jgi:hypothetical protein
MAFGNVKRNRTGMLMFVASLSCCSAQAGAILSGGAAITGAKSTTSSFSVSGLGFSLGGSHDVPFTPGPVFCSSPCSTPGSYTFEYPIESNSSSGFYTVDGETYSFSCGPTADPHCDAGLSANGDAEAELGDPSFSFEGAGIATFTLVLAGFSS